MGAILLSVVLDPWAFHGKLLDNQRPLKLFKNNRNSWIISSHPNQGVLKVTLTLVFVCIYI